MPSQTLRSPVAEHEKKAAREDANVLAEKTKQAGPTHAKTSGHVLQEVEPICVRSNTTGMRQTNGRRSSDSVDEFRGAQDSNRHTPTIVEKLSHNDRHLVGVSNCTGGIFNNYTTTALNFFNSTVTNNTLHEIGGELRYEGMFCFDRNQLPIVPLQI